MLPVPLSESFTRIVEEVIPTTTKERKRERHDRTPVQPKRSVRHTVQASISNGMIQYLWTLGVSIPYGHNRVVGLLIARR